MKAKTGDVIECCSCRAPVGRVVRDVPDADPIIGDDILLDGLKSSDNGPLCARCDGVAALHEPQGIGWTVQIAGRRVR